MMYTFELVFTLLVLCLHYGDASEDTCAIKHGGDCIDPGTTCCRTDMIPGTGICAAGKHCCLPADSCHVNGGICRSGTSSSCGFTPGFCPEGLSCCARERRPGPGPKVCNPVGQEVACEVLDDSNIWMVSGDELLSFGWTVTKDGSAPLDNMQDTCDGGKMLTSTTLCGGKRLCMHYKIPIFLKCMSLLCQNEIMSFNIASDSDGQRWQLHCQGIGVDATIPIGCSGDDADKLCSDLGGSPKVFLSQQPGIPNIISCVFL